MHRLPTNVEEQMIVKAIEEETTWDKLPKRLKVFLPTSEDWNKKVKEYCIKKRLKWSECHARNACKENEYYEDMMRYLRKNLALFPYHLSENICRILRISPFRYYCDMLHEVMKNERPYDAIPNFSAADALREVGIGRNEFIAIMNKCRSKKLMWKLNKSIVKDMLPTQSVDFPIEPWWTVCVVNLSLEEFRKLSEDEMVVIDKVCKEEVNVVGAFDINVVRVLYRRGLIYLDVPVFPDDHFKVSTLEGFVSNREQSYEDPTEELLYAVFVASSEHATIAELGATLQANQSQLEAAVSLASRLGWAKKILDPAALLRESPGSPTSEGSGDEFLSLTSPRGLSPLWDGADLLDASSGETTKSSSSGRMAFMVDANLTSYLMMGSLSPGLKAHAVTLYEAGKLGDSSVADMCEDLRTVESTKFEGELQQFADHAFSLRLALECLRSGGIDPASQEVVGESETADVGLKEYSGASEFVDNPLESEARDIVPHAGESTDHGLSYMSAEVSTPRHSSAENIVSNSFFLTNDSLQGVSGKVAESSEAYENDRNTGDLNSSLSSTHAKDTSKRGPGQSVDTDEVSQSTISPGASDGTIQPKSRARKSRKYRVDVVRCESLAGLAPATLRRVFRRDYSIVVSMIPLASPPGVVSPDGGGPVHFGPPSRAAVSPWMRLLLYHVAGSGPISVALIRGLRLRLLPPPLARCAKALVWSWDGTVVNGIGGKFEGTVVEGNILLHCLNSLLKHSAVFVQPFQQASLTEKGGIITKDIALPMEELDLMDVRDGKSTDSFCPQSSIVQAASELHLQSVGYMTFLRISRSVEGYEAPVASENDQDEYTWVPQGVAFGVPLFDTDLCKRVCEGAVRNHLFHPNSIQKHREQMLLLRRKLQDFYQANGVVPRLSYGGETLHNLGPAEMTGSVSGRWFLPSDEPSTPMSPGLPKVSSIDRQRRRFEVQSFDGDILRSSKFQYPIYEANHRLIMDTSPPTPTQGQRPNALDDDSVEVPLPGVNLIFNGSWLAPINIDACLQGRLPAALVAEASIASEALRQASKS